MSHDLPISSRGRRVVAATLIASGLAGGLCTWLYRREAAALEGRLREREAVRTGLLAYFVTGELRSPLEDLQILADGDGLQAFLADPRPESLERARHRAVFVSRQHHSYDQVRFLDEAGHEILRVDQDGAVVPRESLQDKSSRAYFQKASALDRGDVYVSAFDLNVENGRIEEPFKPTLRLATPVFDGAGRRRGVYVINYRGDVLFRQLETAVPQYAPRLRLLNARGYWLKASDPAQEWGFQVSGRDAATLALSEPGLWARIASEPQGQALRAGGLFSWQRVALTELGSGEGGRLVAEEPYLVVGSEVSASDLATLVAGLRRIFLVLATGLVALAAASAWFFEARGRALRSLRRSEESLAVTLHSIGDAVLATDTSGRVTRMNEVAERLTGWKAAESSGRPVAEIFRIVNEDTRAAAPIPVAAVLATGEVHGLANHTLLVSRDGSERAIADSAAPIRNADGTLLGVVLVFRDVTAERVAERALRESEARYRTLFDSIDEGFCIVEMIFDADDKPVDYRFLETNPSFERQTGLANAVGKRMRELAPQHETHWFETYGRIAVTGEALRFQNRAEQLERTYDVYAFRFGDPKARHVAILFSDISERERARAELDQFFSLSLDFLCISSADGYFKRVSPAVTDVLGWTPEEFLARPYIEFVHPDDTAATLLEVEKQLKAGERVLHFENRYRHKDGGWRVLSWRSMPHDGLMYATARDVTELKELERALRDAKDDAERLVQERTGELRRSNESLERSERQVRELNAGLETRVQERTAELEAANRELESFSYSVSHDLRAPVRHVLGFVDMLSSDLGGALSGNAERYVKTIHASARNMGQLIDDLLAFSRMGRTEMKRARVDLDSVVAKIREDLELALKDREVVWSVEPLPAVQGDVVLIRQVFANLVGNAVKYTRGRSPARIEIGSARRADGQVELFVRDNGAGFDMKYAHKLFGVFQRLHRADEFEGTGIGLANVRRIVTRHGGRTWAEGAAGQGATFYFTLAAAPPVEATP